ncbi:MAG: hypothetical protein R2725_06650 [Solirubrobacterales bacterium]
MNPHRGLRLLVPLAGVALLAVALLASSATAAKVPPFSASAQYKALAKFVDKLDGLAGTPTAAAQKTAYDGQLDNKHQAAVNKSTALFNRAKSQAKTEFDRAFRKGSQTIRRSESGELASLRSQYDARLASAAANYEAELGRIQDEFGDRIEALHKEIKRLRKQKAAAATAQQPQFQEAIERRVDRLVADGELEREELADLKAAYGKEKTAIRAAKASAAQLVLKDDDAAIQKLRNDHTRIYNARVATIQGKRDNQLVDLDGKLDAGKAAIERMPVSG